MANGMNPFFNLMPTTDPQASAQQSMAAQAQQAIEQNREQGMMMAQPTQGPAGMPPPTGFGGPGGMERMSQIYGLMARTADDPTAVMQNYVRAMQEQQRLDELSSPAARISQMYGAVNPHDWTSESLQAYHNHFVQTGQRRFDLLERKRGMSTKTEDQIFQAHEKIQSSGQQSLRAADIASRLEKAARTGDWQPGFVGRLQTWFRGQGIGDYTSMEAIKTDFNKYVNTEVINGLPAGVASDRDIMIFSKGFPPDYADAAYLAAWMRGAQKAKVLEQAFYRHKSMYLSARKGPEGLSMDWEDRRNRYAKEALDAAGLATWKPDASLSDEDAARAYFSPNRGYIDIAAETGTAQQPPAGPMVAPGTQLRIGEPAPLPDDPEALVREFL